MQLDLARGGATGQLQRGGEAQRLLDGVGDQRGVREQQVALVGVLGQQLEHGAGQPGRRLDAAQEQHHHQPHDLRGGLDVGVDERRAVDVGLHEVADQVVAGPATTVVEQLDEVVLDAAGGRLGHRGEPDVVGRAVLELVHPAHQLAAALGLGVGQAEHPEEHLVGHRPGQLGGQVDRSRRSASRRRARGPPAARSASARRSAAAGSRAGSPGGSGRAAGCPGRAGSPARSGPSRCRRCRCPRRRGTSPGRARRCARRRSATAPTSSTSRCSRPAPRRAAGGRRRTGPAAGSPCGAGRSRAVR